MPGSKFCVGCGTPVAAAAVATVVAAEGGGQQGTLPPGPRKLPVLRGKNLTRARVIGTGNFGKVRVSGRSTS